MFVIVKNQLLKEQGKQYFCFPWVTVANPMPVMAL
jgi:hypothetical protein